MKIIAILAGDHQTVEKPDDAIMVVEQCEREHLANAGHREALGLAIMDAIREAESAAHDPPSPASAAVENEPTDTIEGAAEPPPEATEEHPVANGEQDGPLPAASQDAGQAAD